MTFIVICVSSFLVFDLNTKNMNRSVDCLFIFGKTLMCNPRVLVVIVPVPQKSLGEEVNELTSSRLLKLEKDNQTLLKTVEELRGAASQDAATKLSKASQENQKLNQKVSNCFFFKCFFRLGKN